MIPFLARAAPYLIGAAVIVGGYHMTPVIGPGARIERLADARDNWKAKAGEAENAAERWEASFRVSEIARKRDQAAAVEAASAAANACDARLAEVRRSTKVIERIVNHAPKSDANDCPVRSLVDPGLLRDALHPPG